ncbi:MAG: hypothetical protein M3Y85_06795 [Bacteroidota bacterium]|nr:hypothetical protein [Bacteroidota bacterium]
MKRIEKLARQRFNIKELNSVLAYAASLVLSGISPAVCESVIEEFYSSVRKSVHKIIT